MDINKNMKVQGVDFEGRDVAGKVEHIVGFGDVAVVRVNEDRMGLRYCYVENLKEAE